MKRFRKQKTVPAFLAAAFGLVYFSCASYQSEIRLVTGDLDCLSLAERNELAVVQILLVKDGDLVTGGSGCFVNEHGALVTAAHIVRPACDDRAITVLVNYRGALYRARIADCDAAVDLALLEVKTRTPVACVRFAPAGAALEENGVTFLALPPAWGLYKDNAYQAPVTRLEIRNHRVIRLKNAAELFSSPDTAGFFSGIDLAAILAEPAVTEIISDPARLAAFALSAEAEAVLLFFLGGGRTRIFFKDPGKQMLAGYSGGLWFDAQGRLLGLFQEILILFKPNPASRYIRVDRPPEDSPLFPLMESMLCAGQGAEGIRSFLDARGVRWLFE